MLHWHDDVIDNSLWQLIRQGLATSDDEANARGIPSTTEWVARECITIEYIHARGGRCCAVEDDDIQQQQMQQQEQQVNDVGDESNSSTSLAGNNSNIKDFIVIVDGTSKRQQRKPKRKLLLQEQKREDAVWHLMRVAGGLDSLVVGKGQILSQVRQCHLHSIEDDGCGGKVLS